MDCKLQTVLPVHSSLRFRPQFVNQLCAHVSALACTELPARKGLAYDRVRSVRQALARRQRLAAVSVLCARRQYQFGHPARIIRALADPQLASRMPEQCELQFRTRFRAAKNTPELVNRNRFPISSGGALCSHLVRFDFLLERRVL